MCVNWVEYKTFTILQQHLISWDILQTAPTNSPHEENISTARSNSYPTMIISKKMLSKSSASPDPPQQQQQKTSKIKQLKCCHHLSSV